MPAPVSTQAFSRRRITTFLYWLQIQALQNDSRGTAITIVSLLITLIMISFVIQLLLCLRVVVFIYMLKSGYRLWELQQSNAYRRSSSVGDLDRIGELETQESLQQLPVEELD